MSEHLINSMCLLHQTPEVMPHKLHRPHSGANHFHSVSNDKLRTHVPIGEHLVESLLESGTYGVATCRQCKHQFACMIQPSVDRTFENKQ